MAIGTVALWRPWDAWADLYRDSWRDTCTGLALGVGRPLATVREALVRALGDRAWNLSKRKSGNDTAAAVTARDGERGEADQQM